MEQGNYSYRIDADAARDVTRQLDYYKNLGTSTIDYSGAIRKNGTGAFAWWLRSADSESSIHFYTANDAGTHYGNFTYVTLGVSPAFRIG